MCAMARLGWLIAVAAVAVGFLSFPGGAAAHLRTGTVAVDYRASISAPDTQAYTARIYQSDHGLSLTLRPGHTIVLLGYLREPVFRLDATGLWVNAASPTAVVVGLLKKGQRVEAALPRWRLQRGRRSVAWHDARVQGLPPGIERGTWTVPLTVDGRVTTLQGELERFPAPSLPLWLGALACLLVAGVAPLALRRRRRWRDRDLVGPAAIACAVAAASASAVIAPAFALDGYASPGTWILGLDALAFLAVGIGVLFRGPQHLQMAAAIGVGLVGLAVGLVNGAVFLHPIVLAILPGDVIRALCLIAIAAGLSATALGCVLYAESAAARPDGNLDFFTPPHRAGAGRAPL
jgi:hypothetical protein